MALREGAGSCTHEKVYLVAPASAVAASSSSRSKRAPARPSARGVPAMEAPPAAAAAAVAGARDAAGVPESRSSSDFCAFVRSKQNGGLGASQTRARGGWTGYGALVTSWVDGCWRRPTSW
eukprot:2217939-Pleurochrysis_carterae.AAC.3